MPNRLKVAITVLVAVVWALNFSAPVFVKDYKPIPELNLAFMAILGVITASWGRETGSDRNRRRRDDDEDEDDEDEDEGEESKKTPPQDDKPNNERGRHRA